jgi:hypothetical protein
MVQDLPDRSDVAFDDERVVVNAGIVLAVTLGRRLGLEALVDAVVRLAGRPGAARPGRKVLSLVHAMLVNDDRSTFAHRAHGPGRPVQSVRSRCAPTRVATWSSPGCATRATALDRRHVAQGP